jgi:AraC-like DNA-binding protein
MEFREYPNILGYMVQNVASPVANINYYKRTAQWGRIRHTHDEYQFFVVTQGSVTLVCEGVNVLAKGQASLIPPDCPHEIYSTTGYEQIGIDVSPREASDYMGIVPLLNAYIKNPVITQDFTAAERAEEMLRLLANNSTVARSRACMIMGTALLNAIECIVYGDDERFDERLSEYLEQHLSENLSTARIAENFHISIPQLERLSRRYFGSGVIALYNQKRLSRACALLTSTAKSVSEIAQETGFFDASHFSGFFSRNMGKSPSKYRKRS